MKMLLNESDFSKLRPETVADILSLLTPTRAAKEAEQDANPVVHGSPVDLSLNQVQHYMETPSDAVRSGIKYIAINGPAVWGQDLLEGSDVTTLRDFQGATTKRARTVTKVEGATLLGWDDWNEYEDHPGRYGVTDVTFASLRRYFDLD
ncbi:hypothetical protein [Sphingomonas sp. M1A8_2b]